MEDRCQFAHTNAGAHEHRHFVDHFACSSCNDGGAENFVSTISDMNFNETVVLSIGYRAINILHHNRETFHGNRSLSGFPHMHADMSDFRIAIGAPRNQ